jgi:hypothetical protein
MGGDGTRNDLEWLRSRESIEHTMSCGILALDQKGSRTAGRRFCRIAAGNGRFIWNRARISYTGGRMREENFPNDAQLYLTLARAWRR